MAAERTDSVTGLSGRSRHLGVGPAGRAGGATEVRWDIVSNAPPTDFNVRPGAAPVANVNANRTLFHVVQ